MMRRTLSFTLLLAVLPIAGAACKGKGLAPIQVTRQQIVRQNAMDAFQVNLNDAEDKEALSAFAQAIRNAAARDDVKREWAANRHLAEKDRDLPERVFRHAQEDGGWPAEAAPESDFAEGLRAAIAEYAGAGP